MFVECFPINKNVFSINFGFLHKVNRAIMMKPVTGAMNKLGNTKVCPNSRETNITTDPIILKVLGILSQRLLSFGNSSILYTMLPSRYSKKVIPKGPNLTKK